MVIPAEEMAQADENDRGIWIKRPPTKDELVNDLLENLQVFAVASSEGSPVLETYQDGSSVGRFYFNQEEAASNLKRLGSQMQGLQVLTLPLSEVYLPYVVRGDAKELGGRLELQPAQRDLEAALARLGRASLGPQGGLVPLFLCQELLLGEGKDAEVPLFLHEGDLKAALRRLLRPEEAEAASIQVTTLQGVASQLLEGKDASGEPRLVVIGSLDDL